MTGLASAVIDRRLVVSSGVSPCRVGACCTHAIGVAGPRQLPGNPSGPKGLKSRAAARGCEKGLGAMERISLLGAALAAMCLLPAPASADAANGERLGRQWCARFIVVLWQRRVTRLSAT